MKIQRVWVVNIKMWVVNGKLRVELLVVNVHRNIFVNTNYFTFCHDHAISRHISRVKCVLMDEHGYEK